MAPVRSDYAIEQSMKEVERQYGVLEGRLLEAEWLAGDKYTIADMAHFTWMRASFLVLGIDPGRFPRVQNWVERIEGREAVQRALRVPEGTFTKEQLAEHFRPGRDAIAAKANTDKPLT